MCAEHIRIRAQDLLPQTVADVIHPLTERFGGRDTSCNTERVFEEFRVVLHLIDRFILRFSLAEQADVGEEDIPILDLGFTAFFVHRNAVTAFHKLAFPQHPADNPQSARCDQTFLGKYYFDAAVVHGITLLPRAGYIIPYS